MRDPRTSVYLACVNLVAQETNLWLQRDAVVGSGEQLDKMGLLCSQSSKSEAPCLISLPSYLGHRSTSG